MTASHHYNPDAALAEIAKMLTQAAAQEREETRRKANAFREASLRLGQTIEVKSNFESSTARQPMSPPIARRTPVSRLTSVRRAARIRQARRPMRTNRAGENAAPKTESASLLSRFDLFDPTSILSITWTLLIGVLFVSLTWFPALEAKKVYLSSGPVSVPHETNPQVEPSPSLTHVLAQPPETPEGGARKSFEPPTPPRKKPVKGPRHQAFTAQSKKPMKQYPPPIYKFYPTGTEVVFWNGFRQFIPRPQTQRGI